MNRKPKFGRSLKKKKAKKTHLTKSEYRRMQKHDTAKSLDDFFAKGA